MRFLSAVFGSLFLVLPRYFQVSHSISSGLWPQMTESSEIQFQQIIIHLITKKTFFKIVCVLSIERLGKPSIMLMQLVRVQFRNYDGKLRPTLIDVTKHFNHNECIYAIFTLKLNTLRVKNVMKKVIIIFFTFHLNTRLFGLQFVTMNRM